MKICVHLRDTAGLALHEGNFRSEPRIERMILEALMGFDWVTEIYTMGQPWVGGEKLTSKYKGPISKGKESEVVLILQDWGFVTPEDTNYLAYIVKILAMPPESAAEGINKLSDRMGKRFVFTAGHTALFEDEVVWRVLFRQFKIDRPEMHLLPYPGIPESRFKDNFDKKTILLPQRLISMAQLLSYNNYTHWALRRIRKDSSLNIRILTGASKESFRNVIAGVNGRMEDDISSYFWKMEEFKEFMDVKDRVHFYYGMDWSEVLKIYSDSKILALAGRQYGGPPLEAAMHGVPFVGKFENQGSLCRCSDYLSSGNKNDVYNLLDRLMDDREFYTKIAKSYHDYAMDNHSYEAYGKNLYALIKSMDLNL